MDVKTNNDSRLRYVAVELFPVNGHAETEIVNGLFRGYKPKAGDAWSGLVLLGTQGRNDVLKCYSLDHYAVMSVTASYDCGGNNFSLELMVFNRSKEDQDLAVDVLKGLQLSLINESKMLTADPSIVDLDKYVDVPYSLSSANSTIGDKTAMVPKTYPQNQPSYGYGYGYYNAHDYEKEKKEKERQQALRYTPYLIERKGGLPSAEKLAALKKKIYTSVKKQKVEQAANVCIETADDDGFYC